MSLAACISPLALDDALAGLVVAALGQVVLQHRRGGFLDLEEQRVVLVAALQQDDERAGADAADADDLAGHVDELEALQQLAPIVRQGRPVRAELVVDQPAELVGGQAVGVGQVA